MSDHFTCAGEVARLLATFKLSRAERIKVLALVAADEGCRVVSMAAPLVSAQTAMTVAASAVQQPIKRGSNRPPAEIEAENRRKAAKASPEYKALLARKEALQKDFDSADQTTRPEVQATIHNLNGEMRLFLKNFRIGSA